MKQKYPLYRQSLEFYVALKLLTYFKSLPNKSNFVIPEMGYTYLATLLDSVILTQKSSIDQILPTNTASVRIKEGVENNVEIGNHELLAFESSYNIIEYLKQKFPNQDEISIQKMLTLVFSNESGFIDSLEKNLQKYLVHFVDDKLHEANACKFEYQVEVIRNKIVELAKTLNLNHIKLDSQSVFPDCNCQSHFIEIIGALSLSGSISLHQINLDLDSLQYTATIGIEYPEKIEMNIVRSYFGLKTKTNLKPTFLGDTTYIYENGQLRIKLADNSVVSFDLAKSTKTRCLFETFYELRKIAPQEKEIFSIDEIITKYAELHKWYPIELRTIKSGFIGEWKGNCVNTLFKGPKRQYRDHIEWDHKDSPIEGYTFRIK